MLIIIFSRRRVIRLSQTLQTVLLSLATSLIVSIITFILGLKSGKNQTDRAKLQGIYKQLHSHFEELKEALLHDSPKTWTAYKKIERGMYSAEFFPPVKEMKRNGELLFIKKKIADNTLELETALMNYASNLKHHIPELHAALISDLSLYKEGYTFKKYSSNKNETSHFEAANPTKCNSFRPQNYNKLFNRADITELFNCLNGDSPCAVEFSLGNPIEYSFKLYPESLTVTVDEYTKRIIENLERNISEYADLCNQKQTLIAQIDKLNKKIERRVREPISFWETIFGAFADMFR